MPLQRPTEASVQRSRAGRRVAPYAHIVEFDKTFIVPFTRGDRLDITKLLEFATNLVVIDGLTRSRIPQRYNQGTLESVAE